MLIVSFIAYGVTVEAQILPFSGCWNASGELLGMATLQKDEKAQIPATNYSFMLADAKWGDHYTQAASIRLFNNTEFIGERILLLGCYGKDKVWQIDDYKIVLDKVFENQTARFGIYFIET